LNFPVKPKRSRQKVGKFEIQTGIEEEQEVNIKQYACFEEKTISSLLYCIGSIWSSRCRIGIVFSQKRSSLLKVLCIVSDTRRRIRCFMIRNDVIYSRQWWNGSDDRSISSVYQSEIRRRSIKEFTHAPIYYWITTAHKPEYGEDLSDTR
jgi:hypothetical protein